MASHAATKATAQTVMAMTRRRPPSGDAGGSVRAGGWGSVTTAIGVKVNDGHGIDRRGPPAVHVGGGRARIVGRVLDGLRRAPRLTTMQEQPEPAFAPGLTAQVELTVTDADTAQAVGSGDVPVLGTPRVLALAEAATVAATATGMPPGSTTVGTRVELEHLAPTVVGRTVRGAGAAGGRRRSPAVVRGHGQRRRPDGGPGPGGPDPGRPGTLRRARRAGVVNAGFVEVADRVHVLAEPLLRVNVTLVVGDDEALLVDTLSRPPRPPSWPRPSGRSPTVR